MLPLHEETWKQLFQRGCGPSIPKQPVQSRLPESTLVSSPGDDDGFDYFDTPTKTKPSRAKQKPIDEDLYDLEDSDEELYIKLNPRPPPDFTTQAINDPTNPWTT